MSVYLGYTGSVELDRDSTDAPLETVLDPSDVNVSRRRFSVDFNVSALITGDRVEIATVDGSTLQLVSGHTYPDGSWYIHIDDAGGIRLYDQFQASLSGQQGDALELVAPSTVQNITIQTKNDRYRFMAKIRDFELTTSRDTVDLTSLGNEFRSQYEQGLISGQGVLNCLWESSPAFIGPGYRPSQPEFPSYLARLVVRVQQGADFNGRFFIYAGSTGQPESVWYEAKCIVTNVSVSVSSEGAIETRIDFVTSDQIVLKQGRPPVYLLQESGDYLLQEDGSPLLQED
jgi:hypothetical protein